MELRILKKKAVHAPDNVAISQADKLLNRDKKVLQYRYLIGATTHLRTHSEWMDVPVVEENPNVSIGFPRSAPQLKTEITKLEVELRKEKSKLNRMSLGMERLKAPSKKGLLARVWVAVLNKPLV